MKSDIASTSEQQLNYLIEEKYEISKTIGKGTFGKVKLGIHKETKQKVAIKILEKNKIISKDDSERVRRELDILSKFSHMNVIQIIEIIDNKHNYFIVMEYCEGGELFNYIVDKQNLEEDEAALFYYQLINGLEYIHSHDVVHRDLKPENLLLMKGKILKIIDFGLSNYYNGIFLKTPCGSPCYASPEMVSGQTYNGFYIDVWSTGIILFAMLCGYLPFEDDDNEILFKQILHCRLDYPTDIPKKAKDLLKKILVTNPEKRIKIKEIKEHPFYLHGRDIYNFEIGASIVTEKPKEFKPIIPPKEIEIKYIPLSTEQTIPYRSDNKAAKYTNITEPNIHSEAKSSIKEKIEQIRKVLYSKSINPKIKTISAVGERNNNQTHKNAKDNYSTLKEKDYKITSLNSPKERNKTTITKKPEIRTTLVTPLSSFINANKKFDLANLKATIERTLHNSYIPMTGERTERFNTSSEGKNSKNYFTYRHLSKFTNFKDFSSNLDSKSYKNNQPQVSPNAIESKQIITEPNIINKDIIDKIKKDLQKSTTITTTSYNKSFLEKKIKEKKKELNQLRLYPTKTLTDTSLSMHYDYYSKGRKEKSNGKQYCINKGNKYTPSDSKMVNNYMDYNINNLEINLNHNAQKKRRVPNKQNPISIYLGTEPSTKQNNFTTKFNDFLYSNYTNSTYQPIVPHYKAKNIYSPSGIPPSSLDPNNTLNYLRNKIRGIYQINLKK